MAYLEASSSGSFICSQVFSWGCSQSQGLTEDGESASMLTHMLSGRPVSDVRLVGLRASASLAVALMFQVLTTWASFQYIIFKDFFFTLHMSLIHVLYK